MAFSDESRACRKKKCLSEGQNLLGTWLISRMQLADVHEVSIAPQTSPAHVASLTDWENNSCLNNCVIPKRQDVILNIAVTQITRNEFLLI